MTKIRLQYLQNERAQDTWFLLLISAIVAHLRLVEEIKNGFLKAISEYYLSIP